MIRLANETRCRLSIQDLDSGFCSRHARSHPKPYEAAELTAALPTGTDKFTSAYEINHFLSKLLILLAQDRISPRRAAVLAYITNQLLRTLPAIERELEPQSSGDAAPIIVNDLPRPSRE